MVRMVLLLILVCAIREVWAAKPVDIEKLWVKKCQACHGAGGRGNQPMARFLRVTPEHLDLTTPEAQGKSDGTLLGSIANGQGKMPGFANQLSLAKRIELLKHLRSFVSPAPPTP